MLRGELDDGLLLGNGLAEEVHLHQWEEAGRGREKGSINIHKHMTCVVHNYDVCVCVLVRSLCTHQHFSSPVDLE